MIESDYDIIIGVDRRGVAHVVKHRFHQTNKVTAEVKLTATTTQTETYGTEPNDTGLLAPVGQVEPRRARVAVDSAGIKALLSDACDIEGQWVEISGAKVDGSRFERRVKPISVQTRGFISTDYLYCHVAGGETRTYRLDGIERAEFIDIVTAR